MTKELTIKEQNAIKFKDEILEVIKNNRDITHIKHIFNVYSGCTRETFYQHEFNNSDIIKQAIEDNRTAIKQSFLKNWQDNKASASLQIAGYKLLADEDERKVLSQTFIENTGPAGGPIQLANLSEQEINRQVRETIRDVLNGGDEALQSIVKDIKELPE